MIQYTDLIILSPPIVIAASSIAVMLTISFYRNHRLTVYITAAGLSAAFALSCLIYLLPDLQQQITPLLIVDRYSLFFTTLIAAAGLTVALFSYPYLKVQAVLREEYYLLLLLATLGAVILTATTHFASFFLGLETLTVSLYGLTAYLRDRARSIEAGVKYLILAAISSAFLLLGMALVYAETGSMEFAGIASRIAADGVHSLPLTAGFVLIIVGIGFKLAVVPFHLWTPDVYEGAPAPVTGFVATVSKGAVFAVVLRYFSHIELHTQTALVSIFTVVATASMFVGNLLALLQDNVKRILAYSSISHLGYLLVAFLAGGPMAATSAAFYLSAYFITTLGAFGIIAVLSPGDRDADNLEDYRGLALRRPWHAAVFTAMLLSLAGLPLTAGFVGKFYIVAAGIGAALWFLVSVLVINSVIGLFYYLRIVTAMYSDRGAREPALTGAPSAFSGGVLALLTIGLIWLGVYPGPLIDLIDKAMRTVN